MDNSHKTAISRRKPSAPARSLSEAGCLKGRVLDYGCGKGKDAAAFGLEAYDPHYFPTKPAVEYDTILCTYVLNVIPAHQERKILADIRRLLKPEGVAYVTVRRDLKERYVTRANGNIQRLVYLPLPVMQETSGYCIYRVTKE